MLNTSKSFLPMGQISMRMFFKNTRYLLILVLLVSNCVSAQKTFSIVNKTSKAIIVYDDNSTKLDSIVANLLAEDIERVTSVKPQIVTDISKASGDVIVIGSVQSSLIQKFVGRQTSFYKNLAGKWECFGFSIIEKPSKNISRAFIIAGSDARGAVYGVFAPSPKRK